MYCIVEPIKDINIPSNENAKYRDFILSNQALELYYRKNLDHQVSIFRSASGRGSKLEPNFDSGTT